MEKNMVELVKYLVTELVEKKDEVIITEDGEIIKVSVAKSDMGKVIGRQGKIAKSIRTIVKAASAGEGKKYTVEILEAQDGDADNSIDEQIVESDEKTDAE